MRIIETFAHNQLKMAQNAPRTIYWLPSKSTDQLPTGTKIVGQDVFKNQQTAERFADQRMTEYRFKSKGGSPTVTPVKLLNPTSLTNQQTHLERLRAIEAEVIGPPVPTKNAKINHDGQGKTFIKLFELSGSTSGSYGYDGDPDVPAQDCHQHVEWEPTQPIIPQLEQALKGNPVLVAGETQRYFHSCNFRGEIFASFNSELDEQLRDLIPNAFFYDGPANVANHLRNSETQSFIFQSQQQMIQQAADLLNINSPETPAATPQPNAEIPKPGQSPDQYWKKRTEIELLKKPQPLNGD